MSGFLTKERYAEMWKRHKGKPMELPEGINRPIVDEYGYLVLTKVSAQRLRGSLLVNRRASASLSLPNGTALTFHAMEKEFSVFDLSTTYRCLSDSGPSRGARYVVCIEYRGAFGFRADSELYPSYLEEKLRMSYSDAEYFAPWLTEVLKMSEGGEKPPLSTTTSSGQENIIR